MVFDPLEMRQSSYIWRADFETDYALPHDAQPAPGNKQRPSKARSASTLHTTAADYARFLQAVLSGARLKPDTAKQWLDPQVRLRQHCIQCLSTDAGDWTTQINLNEHSKFDFSRMPFPVAIARPQAMAHANPIDLAHRANHARETASGKHRRESCHLSE